MFESEKNNVEGTVNYAGFNFHIDNTLKELQPQFGEIVVDFVEGLFGKTLSIKFDKMPSC